MIIINLFVFRLEETIDEEDDDGEGRQSMIAYLNLVDLAGSEKAGQTGAEGTRYIFCSRVSKFAVKGLEKS